MRYRLDMHADGRAWPELRFFDAPDDTAAENVAVSLLDAAGAYQGDLYQSDDAGNRVALVGTAKPAVMS